MRRTKVLILVISTSVLSSYITYFCLSGNLRTAGAEITNLNSEASVVAPVANAYRVERLQGYHFIKPLMYGERVEEPKKYASIKTELKGIINDFKKDNTITSASVYLRDFEKNDWLGINTDVLFHPGSLMKLPVLITYLKLSEMHPEILNKKLMITSMPKGFPLPSYNSKQIEVGKQYTVKELLEYMISYSDNNATYLLNNNLDLQAFKKAFTDLHLIVPDVTDRMYTTTTKEYSTFFEVLYNAGYLSIENSEFAMRLLSKCDFTKGFVAGLPAGVPIVHKFGEWSDSKTIHELHETGIIYINQKAYIFSVMTRGEDVMKLPKVIATLTKSVYNNISTSSTPDKLAMVEKHTFN